MNTSNKADPKAITTTATQKIDEKPITLTQPELKKPAIEVKKSELPSNEQITITKEPIVPVKESDSSDQPKKVIEKSEPAKPAEQSKRPTKADKAKGIYDEMATDPKNDRQDIIAR